MQAPGAAPDAVRLSVIIPVRDRVEKLRACLASLAPQKLAAPWEVLVAIDGGPAAPFEALARDWPADAAPLRLLHLPAGGPARARNLAHAEAKGEVFLYLNDDVTLAPGCLAAHDRAHRAQPGHATAGNTRWSPRCCTTDFMHWVAHHDDFFYMVEDRADAGWDHWHTLNASLDRQWIDAGHGFDETYPDPAFEDTELAARLARDHRVKFRLAADAVAEHDHFYTPDEYLAKSWMRGASARRFVDAFPEKRDRILREYEQAASGARGRLLKRALRGQPDGVEEWHARFAMAFLAGFEGRRAPWLARRCR